MKKCIICAILLMALVFHYQIYQYMDKLYNTQREQVLGVWAARNNKSTRQDVAGAIII